MLWKLLFIKYYCKYWGEEHMLEGDEYKQLLVLQEELRKVRRQCKRYPSLPELAEEVF